MAPAEVTKMRASFAEIKTAAGIDPATAPANHSPKFLLDEGALETGTRAMLQAALDYLGGSDSG